MPPSVPSEESGQAADPDRNSARKTVSDARVQAISSARYKVTFTASAELRDKLDRLRELTRASHHGGDLAAIIEEAITEKLERVEARRLGKVKSRSKDLSATDTSAGSRHIPAAVKRAVSERDADRCTFVNATGRRCHERAGLEFHHDKPFALGGDRSPSNIRLLCRAHNAFFAEETYGPRAVDRHPRARLQSPGDPAGSLFASGVRCSISGITG